MDCCILCCYCIICSSSIWCRTFFNATSDVYLYDYIDFHRYSWYSKQWHCIDYNVTYNNGLPIEIMGMIVGIFRLIDMIHTALNVTGDVVSTLAVARIEHMYKE